MFYTTILLLGVGSPTRRNPCYDGRGCFIGEKAQVTNTDVIVVILVMMEEGVLFLSFGSGSEGRIECRNPCYDGRGCFICEDYRSNDNT